MLLLIRITNRESYDYYTFHIVSDLVVDIRSRHGFVCYNSGIVSNWGIHHVRDTPIGTGIPFQRMLDCDYRHHPIWVFNSFLHSYGIQLTLRVVIPYVDHDSGFLHIIYESSDVHSSIHTKFGPKTEQKQETIRMVSPLNEVKKQEILTIFQNNRITRAMAILVNRGFTFKNPGFIDAADLGEVESLGFKIDTEDVMTQPSAEALVDGSYNVFVFIVEKDGVEFTIKVADLATGFAAVS